MLSADEIEIIKEQAYCGLPSKLPNVCKVYPGMMKEMLEMGSDTYSQRLGLLLLTSSQIDKILAGKNVTDERIKNLHPLEYLLKSAQMDDTFLLELEKAFSTFIKEEVLLLPRMNAVLIGSKVEKRLITKDNFEDFQAILRIQNHKKVPTPPPENESAFEKKMRLAAEMRDEIKRKQEQKNGEVQNLTTLLEIADVFGINYMEKSIYAFYRLIERHQKQEKWNQDIQMLCAGADSNKIKIKYWGLNSKD